MSKNKGTRDLMLKKYGAKCFIEELGLRTKAEINADLKRFKSKGQRKKMDELTYHHIMEKSKGGETTERNGAILRAINHQWLHRLSPERQAEINRLLQEYKLSHYKKCEIEYVDDVGFEVKGLQVIFEEQKELREELREEYDERNYGGY